MRDLTAPARILQMEDALAPWPPLQSARMKSPASPLVPEALEVLINMLEHGVLIVDVEARVLFVNGAAEEFLQETEWLRVVDGVVVADSKRACHQLQHALAKACGSSAGATVIEMPYLERAGHDRVWMLIASLRAARNASLASLWIFRFRRNEAANVQLLGRVFGLTMAESHLAASLTCGHTIRHHARLAGIGVGTARSYLRKIFAKTGARRQAELVAMLSGVRALRLPEHGTSSGRKAAAVARGSSASSCRNAPFRVLPSIDSVSDFYHADAREHPAALID